MIVCAGKNEQFDFATTLGVGLIQSTLELTKICLTQHPSEIVFVGSAGAYDKSLHILDIFLSNEATQIEYSFTQKLSYTPLENHLKSLTTPSQKNINVSYETKIINSSNYIHTDSTMAQAMLSKNISLENMEFFTVLQVAQYFEIPCVGIFCVSNYCDDNAHKDFCNNHQAVKEKLQSFVGNHFLNQAIIKSNKVETNE